MRARVSIFNVNNLQNNPIILDNNYPDIQDCSTWSLDIYLSDDKNYVAVGSNSKIISLWEISNILNNSNNIAEE